MARSVCTRCDGEPLLGGHCVGHLTSEEVPILASRLQQGAVLDARNAEVSQVALARLLSALRDGNGERAELAKADFGGATLVGPVDFSRVVFKGEARFSGATFDSVRFSGATFRAGARFRDATFCGQAYFREAQFDGGVYLARAKFVDGVTFERVKVEGPFSLAGARFEGKALFRHGHFCGNARFDGSQFGGVAKFDQAHFGGNADFRKASFAGDASYFMADFDRLALFEQAQFHGDAVFKKSTFAGSARFHRASFSTARFARSHFHDTAIFDRAEFAGQADFNEARFDLSAGFRSACFQAPVGFGGAVFARNVTFDAVNFEANARLADVSFEGETRFADARFHKGAVFRRAAFLQAREIGPLNAERVDFDGAVFREHVRIEAVARVVSAIATTFVGGTHLQLDGGDIALDEADFVRQSTLLGLRNRPRLISLRGAHVAPLILSNLDLRPCRFFGAHGLESMGIEASCLWLSTPHRRGITRRETIVEEHRWRDEFKPVGRMRRLCGRLRFCARIRWYSDELHSSAADDYSKDTALTAGQIATLYRALRKAREDNKDEAGAGDLYYGEMEMRRHAGTSRTIFDEPRLRAESAVLTAYWIASGYGLRSVRALACLILVWLICGGLLCWFGFQSPTHGYGRAVVFATQSSISLLHAPRARLSVGGELVQVCLRLLGPLLFGLALLAMRARVKR